MSLRPKLVFNLQNVRHPRFFAVTGVVHTEYLVLFPEELRHKRNPLVRMHEPWVYGVLLYDIGGVAALNTSFCVKNEPSRYPYCTIVHLIFVLRSVA